MIETISVKSHIIQRGRLKKSQVAKMVFRLNIIMDQQGQDMDFEEISLNTWDSNGETPLIRACRLNFEEEVRDLLLHPSLDVNMTNGEGDTALLIACSRGYEAIVSLLLSHKDIQVNKDNKDNGEVTPLYMACCNKHPGVVKLLLAREDINVNAQNDDKHTILMSMIMYDIYDTEILRSLLDHKDMDINLTTPTYRYGQGYDYKSALTLACDMGMKKFILMLLQREDIQTTDRNIEAVTNFVKKKYIKQYSHTMDRTVIMNESDDQEILGTALIRACKLNLIEVVRFLLRHPSLDVNIEDEEGDIPGNTALLIACEWGYEAIVSLLLSHKDIQVNKGNINGNTPLMEASFNQYLGIVKLLLAREDIDVNAQNGDDQTALMIMIYHQHYDMEIMKILLDHKDMDVNLTKSTYRNRYGFKNALKMACMYSMTEVISLLLQREDIQTTDNIETITNFVMNEKTGCPNIEVSTCVIDVKDARNIKVVIEKAVSKNLLDIARWLAKTQGYLFGACTGTAALRGSNKKAAKREKINRIFSLSGKLRGLTL